MDVPVARCWLIQCGNTKHHIISQAWPDAVKLRAMEEFAKQEVLKFLLDAPRATI